jgi:hypothetical protein
MLSPQQRRHRQPESSQFDGSNLEAIMSVHDVQTLWTFGTWLHKVSTPFECGTQAWLDWHVVGVTRSSLMSLHWERTKVEARP